MPFVTRYSITTNGAITFTGNTLGLSQLINVNQAGTQGSIGAFVTLTGSQVPTFPIGTTLNYLDNSSEAILNIPPGSSVLYAELIWGGNYLSRDQDITGLINSSITFTTPLGSNTIAPDPATANQPTTAVGVNTLGFYMRSADVTGLIQAAGGGTYSAGGVPGLVDPLSASTNDTNHAGWTLAVVYGNPGLPARDLILFVGAEIIVVASSTDIPLSGFVTPAVGADNGRILLSAQEGDANITGDQALFGPTVGTLGVLSGPNNQPTNFFGSQINNDSGNLDTTGTFGSRNQDPSTLTNVIAGRQGWDITNVDATPFLTNSQTSAVLRLSTSGDLYMPNTIGIQIDVSAPSLQPVKSVDRAFASVGDTLTYTVVIPNNGQEDANNVIFTDAAPPDTSFVPGSFTLNAAPVIGADPNAGVNIGTIPVGGSVTVTFQVIIDALPTPNPIVNQASMSFQYQSSPEGPVLTGSAISNQVTTQVNLAQLTMVKSVDMDTAVIGDTLTYTTVITNTGDVTATNVFFQDIPPAGTLFVPGSVTVNAVPQPGLNPVTGFNISDIPAGGSVTIAFRVIVNAIPVSPQLINTSNTTFQYQVAPGQPPVAGTAVSNEVITLVGEIGIVKSVDKAFATIGNTLTYTAVITNQGSVTANSVFFLDVPPPGSAFIPGTVTVNGVPQPGLNPIVGFSIPAIAPNNNIPPGGVVTVSFRVAVNALPSPPQLTNTASVTYRFGVPPVMITAVSNPVTTQVIVGQLTSVKSVDKAIASIGDTLIYTTVITNTGNVTATNVFFTDDPPADTVFVTGSVTLGGVPQPGLSPSTGFLVGNIPPGSSKIVTFKVQIVSASLSSLIINLNNVTFNYQVDPRSAPIEGSVTSNLVETEVTENMESVCIVVPKVYFSCQERECFPDFTVDLPSTGAPFTFVNITFNKGVIVGNPIFSAIPSRPNFSRAQFTVRIPFVLILKNAMNEHIKLIGDLPDIPKDIVIYLPATYSEFELSLLIETRSELLSNAIFTDTSVQLSIGSFLVTKVTGIVQLLIPAFGFCPEPSPCEDFVNEKKDPCLIFMDSTRTPFPDNFFPPQLE